MASFGDAGILVGSRHVGRLSISNVRPGLAVFPRLILDVGILLQDSPTDLFEPGRPVQRFELRELSGELRLATDAAVGSLYWAGPRRFVRSAAYPANNRIEIICDLDPVRLGRIEDHRAGGVALFHCDLWPSLMDPAGFLDSSVEMLRVTIPRETWLTVLEGLQHTKYDLIEIPYPALDEPEFQASAGHIRDAIAKLNKGDFDESLAACRRAIESLAATLNIGHQVPELEAALTPLTDSERAKAYAGIISRLSRGAEGRDGVEESGEGGHEIQGIDTPQYDWRLLLSSTLRYKPLAAARISFRGTRSGCRSPSLRPWHDIGVHGRVSPAPAAPPNAVVHRWLLHDHLRTLFREGVRPFGALDGRVGGREEPVRVVLPQPHVQIPVVEFFRQYRFVALHRALQ